MPKVLNPAQLVLGGEVVRRRHEHAIDQAPRHPVMPAPRQVDRAFDRPVVTLLDRRFHGVGDDSAIWRRGLG